MKILVLCSGQEEGMGYVRSQPVDRCITYKIARDWRDLNGYRGADQVVILPGFFRDWCAQLPPRILPYDTLSQLAIYLRDPPA